MDNINKEYKSFDKSSAIDLLNQVGLESQFSNLTKTTELRYVTRKHQIAHKNLFQLSNALLDQTLEYKVRLFLAQTIKYSVRAGAEISIDILLNVMQSTGDDSIRSEISYTIEQVIKNNAERLQQNNLVSEMREAIRENVLPEANNFFYSQHNRTMSSDNLMENKFKQENKQAPNYHRRKEQKAVVTKDQQRIKQCQENFISQQTEQLKHNISNALKNRNQKINANLPTQRIPTILQENDGNDRLTFSGTYENIKHLYQLVQQNQPLKLNDKDVYLVEKLSDNEKKWFSGGCVGCLLAERMIVAIYLEISKRSKNRQSLTDQAMDNLLYLLQKQEDVLKKLFIGQQSGSIAKLCSSKEKPRDCNKIEQSLFSKINLINSISGDKVVMLNSVIKEEIELMREDAIEIFFHQLVISTSKFKNIEIYLKVIENCFNDTNKKVKDTALKIILALDCNKNSKQELIFMGCLQQIESETNYTDQKQESIQYINQQLKDQSRYKTLFSEDVVLRISMILRDLQQDVKTKLSCSEIINNYLECVMSDGLTEIQLENCWEAISSNSSETELKTEILRSILLTANQKQSLPTKIVNYLIKKISEFEDKLLNYVIITLGAICNKVQIDSLEGLQDKLFDHRIVVYRQSEIAFEQFSNENSDCSSISSIVADIFCKSIRNGTIISEESLGNLAKTLDCADQQTRILSAKAMYTAITNTFPSDQLLIDLRQHIDDSIIDVAIYATMAYAKGVYSLLKQNIFLRESHLQFLKKIFVFDNLRLGDEDFTDELNDLILSIFIKVAQTHTFQPELFNLFDDILSSSNNNEDSKCLIQAVSVLNIYTSRRMCIPQLTIQALQNALDFSKVHVEVIVSLQNIIKNCQSVGEKIINILADRLFLEQELDVRDQAFQLLDCADCNQDLSDDIFDKLELQRAGRVIKLDYPDKREAISFLNRKTKEGSRLPIDTLISIINDIKDEQMLSIINNVSKNNQMIPDNLTELLVQNLKPFGTKTLLLDIFYNIILNNYKIPQNLCEKLEFALKNKLLLKDVVSVFAQIGQRRETVTSSVFNSLCWAFLEKENQQIRPQIISTIVSFMETSEYRHELINKVLRNGIKDQNDTIINSTINGIQILSKNEKLDESTIKLLVAYVSDAKAKLCLKKQLYSILKIQQLDSLTQTNLHLTNLEINQSTQLVSELMKFSKRYPFKQQNFQQIYQIIDKEPDQQQEAIQILQQCMNKSEFPPQLVDSITNLSASTTIKSLATSCYKLMMLLAEVNCNFSNRSIEFLMILQEEDMVQNILIKIAKYQEVSASASLLIRIKDFEQLDTTPNLNRLLLDICKEQEKGYQLPNSAIQKISQLFQSCFDTLTQNGPSHYVGATIFANVLLTRPSYCSDKLFVSLIESVITSQQPVSLSIVKGYSAILASNNQKNAESTIDSLSDLLEEETTSDELFKAIVECISAAAEITLLTKKGISKLEYCLSNSNEKIRQAGSKGLIACIQKHKESQPFKAWISSIFSQFKKLVGKAEINPDHELIEVIISLKYIDFHKISKKPQREWIRELLLSDLLSKLQASQEQQFDFYWNWLSVENSLQYTGEKSLQVLKIICSKPTQFEEVNSTIILLPKMEFETSIKVIQNNVDYFTGIRLSYIQQLLKNYSKLNVTDCHLYKLAAEIYSKIGLELTEKVLSCISEIQSLRQLVDLIDFVNANPKLKSLDFQVKNLNIGDLRRFFEIRLLEDLFRLPLNRLGLTFIIKGLLDREEITFEMMMRLFSCLKKVGGSFNQQGKAERALVKVLQLLDDYKVSPSHFAQIQTVLDRQPMQEWLRKTSKIVLDSKFDDVTKKSTINLIQELRESNPHNQSILTIINDNTIQNLVEKIKQQELKSTIFKKLCEINKSGNLIFKSDNFFEKMSNQEILQWATSVKKNNAVHKFLEFVAEALKVIKRAYLLHANQDMTDAQIVSCILLLRDDMSQGRLLQVATGEGKSMIVSVTAIYHGLRGRKIDIITSSPILAEREVKEKTNFFAMFGLSCADNGDKSVYLRGVKDCYKKDIVYGDASQFQFDWLRDHYSQLNTLNGRKNEIAIVDEVDSMLIDDIQKISRLSSTVAGMDQLQPVYHFIWLQFQQVKKKIFRIHGTSYCFNGQIFSEEVGLQYEQIDLTKNVINNELNIYQYIEAYAKQHLIEFITGQINNERIKVPSNFQKFANSQLSKWVDNAFVASYYQENQEYVVQEGVIKPVDYSSTGIIQNSMSWSDGLHQFLQIKHKLKMTSETLTTNFLSNMQFFKMYKVNLFGLTGTLGSTNAKNMISKLYDVDVVIIPSIYNKQYLQLPTIISSSKSQWLDQICMSTIEETYNMRGTLIICETIDHSLLIANELKKQHRAAAIKMYTMNNMNQEKQVEIILPGEIIISTNLAGRGTDINTDQIESHGGMQVLLTFLPPNQRVEDQAIGRTSRKGKKGTGRMILNGASLDEQVQVDQQKVKEYRDDIEAKIMEKLYNKELKVIEKKDIIFMKFCELLSDIREKIKKGGKHKFINSEQIYETSILQAIEEQWAMFLHEIDDGKISIDNADTKFENFRSQIHKDYESDDVIKNPYYHITIANYLITKNMSQEPPIQAKDHFNKSINLDKQFSIAAYAGKAWFYLRTKENTICENQQQNSNKNLAIQELTKALNSLAYEKDTLVAVQSQTNQDHLETYTDLSKQLSQKISILGTYANSLKTNINVIKKSQRLIEITKKSILQEEFFSDIEVKDNVKIQRIIQQQNQKYNVTFNDLTAITGCLIKDQAHETILKMVTNQIQEVSITLRFICAEKICDFFNPHIEIKDVPRQTAIAQLRNFYSFYQQIVPANQILHSDSNINAQFTSQFDFIIDIEIVKNNRAFVAKHGLCAKVALEMVENEQDKYARYNLTFFNKNKSYKKLQKYVEPYPSVIVEVLKLSSKDCLEFLQKIQINELNLEITGTKDEIESAIKMIDEDNINTKIIIFDEKKISCSVFDTNSAVNHVINNNEMQMCIQIQQLTMNDARKAINLCIQSSFNLTFTLINHLNELKLLKSRQLNVSFSKMDMKKAQQLISILREENIEFVLTFSELSDKQLVAVISSASTESEEIKISSTKTLRDQFMDKYQPITELQEFQEKGIEYLLIINENRFIPYFSIFAVSALGLIQVSIGIANQQTKVGQDLIQEGIADLRTAQNTFNTRQFSWTNYGKQKAISIVKSVVFKNGKAIKGAAKGLKRIVPSENLNVLEQETVQRTSIDSIRDNFNFLQYFDVNQMAEEIMRQISNYGIKQFKPQIILQIQNQVSSKFCQPRLHLLVSKMQALDSIASQKQLKNKIDKIVADTFNPKLGFMRKLWDSIRMLLYEGIFSDLQQLTSMASIGNRIINTLPVIKEISQVINEVHYEIVKKLLQIEEETLQITLLLKQYCNITQDQAVRITQILKDQNILIIQNLEINQNTADRFQNFASALPFVDKVSLDFRIELINPLAVDSQQSEYISCEKPKILLNQVDFNTDESCKLKVIEFCTSLSNKMKKVDLLDKSKLMKSVSDAIAEEIIRIIEGQLINPWSCQEMDDTDSFFSNSIQDQLIRKSSDGEQMISENQAKFDSLSADPMVQSEQLLELENDINSKQTYFNFFKYQAKKLVIALSQWNIQHGAQKEFNADQDILVRKYVDDYALQIETGKPAEQLEMLILEAISGTSLKIVYDPDYQISQQDQTEGKLVAVQIKGDNNLEGYDCIEKYKLLSANEMPISINKANENDSGYAVFQHSMKKPIQDIRNQTAFVLRSNYQEMSKLYQVEKWVEERLPQEASNILFLGGVYKI